jgi:hypothetical protein
MIEWSLGNVARMFSTVCATTTQIAQKTLVAIGGEVRLVRLVLAQSKEHQSE